MCSALSPKALFIQGRWLFTFISLGPKNYIKSSDFTIRHMNIYTYAPKPSIWVSFTNQEDS